MPRFLLLLLIAFSSLGVATADWPGFLGGKARDAATSFAPPIEWSPDSVAWQTPLPGHGQSSPVVVGQDVYVTAVEGPMKETNLVLCIDAATGRQKWRKSLDSNLRVKNDTYTSRAAPTPVADASGVFAFFESGNLVSITPDGDLRWQRNLIADYGKYQGRFGLGGSLAQTEKSVFVLADNDGPAYLAALDKQTGETIWKTDRESRTAWSSPMIVAVDGEDQIVVSSSGSIEGYAPATGEVLWSFNDVGGNTVASPIAAGDGKFLVGASPGRNGENTEGAKQSNLLMQIEKTESGYEPKVVWRNPQATSSFGSPIVHHGHAYYTNRAGVAYCIDIETGETVYTARLPESNWATPIGIGDHVYFFGKDGTTTVLRSGTEEQIVAKNRLWTAKSGGGGPGGFSGEIQYGFAATPHGFLVRTGTRIFMIGSL